MRRGSLLLILSVAALATIATPAAAQSRYCLQGRNWGYPGNCAFATSGTDAGCGINPRYAFARQRGYRGGPRHPHY